MKLQDDEMALILTMTGGNRGLLLGIVPKQPKTQALAKSIINRYAILACLSWVWTKGQGLAFENDEIKFTTDAGLIIELYADYPGVEPFLDIQAANDAGYETVLNPAKKGVEIRFKEKPPVNVMDALKANGFRWSGKCKTWYARQSPSVIAFAERLKGL